jgi:3',5'-nucleoside bisphosphate phosphatase
MKKALFILLSFVFYVAYNQELLRNEIQVPDIPGYVTLKCDFHMHTVFSDGDVWPTTRIEEAWQSGLDAIAITDHIEYQPHKSDLSSDLNRSYDLAKNNAATSGIILVKALEITRKMPPGHMNALFVKEVDSLKKVEYSDVLKAAKDQGAFVFWNHPGWSAQAPDGIKWYDIHTEFLKNGYFQGLEVANDRDFYPEALAWGLEKNLTILGSSDMHGTLGLFMIQNEMSHRPMTLVFVTKRSQEGIKEALVNHRTAVWFRDKLIGSSVYLEPLFQNAVKAETIMSNQKTKYVKLINHSDFEIVIQITGESTSRKLNPRTSEIVTVKPDLTSLQVTVPAFITGKDTFLTTRLVIQK